MAENESAKAVDKTIEIVFLRINVCFTARRFIKQLIVHLIKAFSSIIILLNKRTPGLNLARKIFLVWGGIAIGLDGLRSFDRFSLLDSRKLAASAERATRARSLRLTD